MLFGDKSQRPERAVASATPAAIAALSLYLRFKNLESNAKDLGDGGIQTLFGNKNSK